MPDVKLGSPGSPISENQTQFELKRGTLSGVAETEVSKAVNAFPVGGIITADQTTIVGDGTTERPLRATGSQGPVFNLPGQTIVNLVGTHNDADLWSGGPRTSRVEIDQVGSPVTTITGIDATGFKDGDFIYLTAGGGGPGNLPDQLVLTDADPASLPFNRIYTPTGKDMRLANNEGVLLIYAGSFGWQTWGNPTTISRILQLSLEPTVTPAALANGSTNDNYNPWAGTHVNSNVRQDTGLTSTITGIQRPGPDNLDGRVVVFANISTTGTILVKHDNAGSSGPNRILCPGGQDLPLGPLTMMTLIYDGDIAIQAWRVLATTTSSSIFVPGAGAGSAIQNNSSGNAATGVDSTVCGENNQLSGEGSFAEGTRNIETITNSPGPGGSSNHLEGDNNQITCDVSDGGGSNHVEGTNNRLTGTGQPIEFNHVEGNGNILTATASNVDYNHVEGNGNHITGAGNFMHVEGQAHTLTSLGDTHHLEGYKHTDTSDGTGHHLEGSQHTSSGPASYFHIEGSHGAAFRESQHAKASGRFAANGDAQSTDDGLVMRGSTPGVGANESIELKYGDSRDQVFTLENGKAYAVKIHGVASITGGTQSAAFEGVVFLATQDGGVIAVNPGAPITVAQVGHIGVGAASWSLAVTIGAGPARLVVTFATGGGVTAAVRCVATIEWTEVGHA